MLEDCENKGSEIKISSIPVRRKYLQWSQSRVDSPLAAYCGMLGWHDLGLEASPRLEHVFRALFHRKSPPSMRVKTAMSRNCLPMCKLQLAAWHVTHSPRRNR